MSNFKTNTYQTLPPSGEGPRPTIRQYVASGLSADELSNAIQRDPRVGERIDHLARELQSRAADGLAKPGTHEILGRRGTVEEIGPDGERIIRQTPAPILKIETN
jgi:hypothetical protein